MENHDQLYRKLQQHIDKETIGFPPMDSGAEITILNHLYTPEQAEAVLYLTYRQESVETIMKRVPPGGPSAEEMTRILEECAKYGVITRNIKNGVKHYATLHYMIGLVEAGLFKEPTPEFLKAVDEYAMNGLFWNKFVNSKVSQMRTIPIEKSVTPDQQIGSYDALKDLIEKSPGPFGVIPCICRYNAHKRGTPCKQTSRKHTCLVFNNTARTAISFGTIKEITRDEALDILRQNAEDGLVLQPANTQEIDYMCSCCGCCCGLLQLHKFLPDPVNHWTTNFYALVDADNCVGCSACVDICQLRAVKIDKEQEIAVVDRKRCLGCGNCVPKCPEDAIILQKKEDVFVPPVTAEELNELIMSGK